MTSQPGFRPAPAGLSADTVWSHTATVFAVASFAMGAAALLYCIVALARRELLPLLLWIGGFGAAIVAEPLLGHLGHLWWPTNFPGPSYTAFEAHIPGLIPPIYSFYLGMLGLLGYRFLARGVSAQQVWVAWAALVATDFALQIVAISLKAYFYYGRQPFGLARLPLVGPVKNGTAYLLIGFLVWLLAPHLKGPARAVFLLVPLTGYLGGAVVTAWPWYLAINIAVSEPVEWLIAAFTFVLCLIVVRGISLMVASSSSADATELGEVEGDSRRHRPQPARPQRV